jgi:regulatory protein
VKDKLETVGEDVVFNRALHILSLREHSTEELRRKLNKRGFPGEIIGSVLSKLTRTGLLDDARFSSAFVREKVNYKQMGRKGLFSELRKRGVGEDIAGGAIAAVMEEEGVDERDLALKLLERRGKSQRKKNEGLLRRRGFDDNIIREILTDRNDDL